MIGVIITGYRKVAELKVFPPVTDSIPVFVKRRVVSQENETDEFRVVYERIAVALPAGADGMIALGGLALLYNLASCCGKKN